MSDLAHAKDTAMAFDDFNYTLCIILAHVGSGQNGYEQHCMFSAQAAFWIGLLSPMHTL